MSQRIAVLDLGTNTFHLLIADVEAGSIKSIILNEQLHVKLGEGGINEGQITQAAFQRGIEALLSFKSRIVKHQVELIRAAGTAALRSAKNGEEFITRVNEITGIKIDIIDGDREASLIFQGVKQALDITENSLIIDIGGGSVEFIFANHTGIQWKKSYPIGAAKLMATFHHSDPITNLEIAAIHEHLEDTLANLKDKCMELNPTTLIGSAGSFETLAQLCQVKMGIDQVLNEKGFVFNISMLNDVIDEILKSTHQDRVSNSAILPVRTDMIVVASVLTKYIIETMNIETVKLSVYALKEGLLFGNLTV